MPVICVSKTKDNIIFEIILLARIPESARFGPLCCNEGFVENFKNHAENIISF